MFLTKMTDTLQEYFQSSYVVLKRLFVKYQKVKLLDDTKIYLGYQVEKINRERCCGLAADNHYMLVCEYECNDAKPEIIVYKKR